MKRNAQVTQDPMLGANAVALAASGQRRQTTGKGTAEEIEARDWAAVRPRDQAALQAFLQKHPESAHKAEAQRNAGRKEAEAAKARAKAKMHESRERAEQK